MENLGRSNMKKNVSINPVLMALRNNAIQKEPPSISLIPPTTIYLWLYLAANSSFVRFAALSALPAIGIFCSIMSSEVLYLSLYKMALAFYLFSIYRWRIAYWRVPAINKIKNARTILKTENPCKLGQYAIIAPSMTDTKRAAALNRSISWSKKSTPPKNCFRNLNQVKIRISTKQTKRTRIKNQK